MWLVLRCAYAGAGAGLRAPGRGGRAGAASLLAGPWDRLCGVRGVCRRAQKPVGKATAATHGLAELAQCTVDSRHPTSPCAMRMASAQGQAES